MVCFSRPRLAIRAKDKGLALKSPTPGVVTVCPARDPSSDTVETESDALSLGRFSSETLEFEAAVEAALTFPFEFWPLFVTLLCLLVKPLLSALLFVELVSFAAC